MGNDLIHA